MKEVLQTPAHKAGVCIRVSCICRVHREQEQGESLKKRRSYVIQSKKYHAFWYSRLRMNLVTALLHRLFGIRRVLVIGPSGSGKTYISQYLRQKHRCVALDADAIPGLCRWVDDEGYPVTFNVSAGKTWLKTHHFLWDLVFLRTYLKRYRRVYVFGFSKNVFDAAPLFDAVYYLHVRPAIIDEHLKSTARANPWGKQKKQREITLRSLRRHLKEAKNAKATIIDVSTSHLPPDELFAKIR